MTPDPAESRSTSASPIDAPEFPDRPWVAVFANPYSGALANKNRVGQFAAAVEAQGLACRVFWERAHRRAVLAHPGLGRRCVCVVAAGGDGTVADVINDRPAVPLAMLPLGTENLFAKQFGFDRGHDALAAAIRAGRSHAIDLGEITDCGAAGSTDAPGFPSLRGRRFSLMLSIGADAEVVRRLARWRAQHPDHLRRVRRSSYARHILAMLLRYPYPALEIHADGRIVHGAHAFFFNLPRYGLGLTFAPDAKGDDGLIDWVVFQHPGSFHTLRYLGAVVRGNHAKLPGVVIGRARSIHINSAAPAPVQADGDSIGFTPIGLEVKPASLQIISA